MTVQPPVSVPFPPTHLIYACMIIATALLFLCSRHVVFCSLSSASIALLLHAQSYAPFRGHTICSATDSSRPEPCFLPRTCHLRVFRFFPPRVMIPSVDMSSASPPLPPNALTATITSHQIQYTRLTSPSSYLPHKYLQNNQVIHLPSHLQLQSALFCFHSLQPIT